MREASLTTVLYNKVGLYGPWCIIWCSDVIAALLNLGHTDSQSVNTRTAKYPLYLQQPRASNDAPAPAVRHSHWYRRAAFSQLVSDTAALTCSSLHATADTLLDALTSPGWQKLSADCWRGHSPQSTVRPIMLPMSDS